jgi:hypothetical protein
VFLFYVVLRQKYIVSGQKYIVSRQKNIRNRREYGSPPLGRGRGWVCNMTHITFLFSPLLLFVGV